MRSAPSAIASSQTLATIDGMTVFPSDANFVLFVPPEPHDAQQVWRRLLDRACSCAT